MQEKTSVSILETYRKIGQGFEESLRRSKRVKNF